MVGEICFFSGNGSSFAIAKELSIDTGCDLIPIDDSMASNRLSENGILGIIFPVYHATYGESGIPDIVSEFIQRMPSLSNKYIFAICTHSGMPCLVLENLEKILLLKDGKLAIGKTIQMNIPFTASEKIKHMIFNKDLIVDDDRESNIRNRLYKEWSSQKKELLRWINEQSVDHVEKTSMLNKFIFYLLFRMQKRIVLKRFQTLSGLNTNDFILLTRGSDRSFYVSKECIRCGICEKICPVKNIKLGKRRPNWMHKCELCFACFQWCPQKAITGKIFEYEKRYHHPQVKLEDMENRRKMNLTTASTESTP